MPVRSEASARRLRLLVIVLAWALCAVYGAIHLDHRWLPHDEGTIAHAADRVAAGELPHADYDEVYTGGLSYLNAAAFELMGTRLINLRLVLYVVFLGWIAALLAIGLRFMSPPGAALTTVAAVAWSFPNYAAPLPSWYNLFLTTFAAVALLRHADTGRRRWLVIAGLCAGASIAIKIVGLYLVAGALLYFVYREAGRAAANETEARASHRARRAFSVLVTVSLLIFLLAVGRLVHATTPATFLDFVLPLVAIVAVVLAREWRARAGEFATRVRRLAGEILPFLGGVALPLVLLVIPWIAAGELDALLHGVFVLPARRLQFAAHAPPGWLRALALPALAVVLAAPFASRPAGRIAYAVAGIAGAAILLLGSHEGMYGTVFRSVVEVVPLALTVAALPLIRWESGPDGPAAPMRDGLFLLLALTSTWSLVRYPFAGPIYYFYVVPLVILVLGALAATLELSRRRALTAVLAFYALFALGWIGTNSLSGITNDRWSPAADDYMPAVPRAGLRMSAEEAAEYSRLVELVRTHGRGTYTFATADAPEVYFLTGMRNPTRTIFDFFDDPERRTERILERLDRFDVTVVVTKFYVPFSGSIAPDLLHALERDYPQWEQTGDYVVRWRP